MKLQLKNINLFTSAIIIISLLFIDQGSKIFIKLNYPLTHYGSDAIIDWGFFKLLFVENKGMAMGAKLNDIIPFLTERTAKLFLTIFRLIAIFGIGYWLLETLKKDISNLFKWALCLIFAGAIGNIIDSLFYGVLFSHSYGQVAGFLSEGGGYAPFLEGHVVDMLQFPLVSWNWPEWIPLVGGEHYTFFKYVFNVADTAISSGVGILIVFNKKIFVEKVKTKTPDLE